MLQFLLSCSRWGQLCCHAAASSTAAAAAAAAMQPPRLIVHRRRVSTSRQRLFLQSFLSARLTERERREDLERKREQSRRLDDLARQAKSVVKAPPATTPEEYFSAEAVAARQIGRQEFYDSIFLYLERYGPTRRGHVEFIDACLGRMQELNVHEDLEAYKALMDVFPKEIMRSRTMWQSEFKHYPKQQNTALALLEKMNDHNVMPDTDMGLRISRIFGTESYVMAKYERMMYWMPKLRHVDPWPVATLTSSGLRYQPEPDSAMQLAVCALRRMCPDRHTRVATYDMDGPGRPFVASAQAPAQQELLAQLPPGAPVYLDGPNRVWYSKHQLGYYVLSADPTPLAREHASWEQAQAAATAGTPQQPWLNMFYDDLSWWTRLRCPGYEDEQQQQQQEDEASGRGGGELARAPSEHELPEATVLALAITSSCGAPDLLLRWIRLLASEPGNEALTRLNVVFRVGAEAGAGASPADNAEEEQP